MVICTLEEFFTGNDDPASIIPNLGPELDVATVRTGLERLRQHPSVHEVFLQLDHLEWDEYPEGEWPYSNEVGVVTTLSLAEVDDLTRELQTDCANGPYPTWDGAEGAPALPPGYHFVSVSWG